MSNVDAVLRAAAGMCLLAAIEPRSGLLRMVIGRQSRG